MLTVLAAVLLAQVTAPPSPPPASSPLPSVAPLQASPASVGMHPGTTTIARITSAAGALTATAGPLITVTVDQATQTLAITAAGQLGHDTVHVTDQTGAAVDIPVFVAQDAGSVPNAVTLKVTGTPMDPAWLSSQISAAVSRNATVHPGATLAAPSPSIAPPQLGTSANVSVPVQISGNGQYLDVAATTSVTVQNVDVEPFAPPTLMYDDDPEHLAGDGVIYRGSVTAGAPSRLYYYHDNTSDPRRIVVALSSSGNRTSPVQIIDSTAGPNIDVMSVGHAVSRDYLLMKPRNEGVIYDVDPSAPLVLHDVPMSSRQLVAGTLGINVLSGGPVTVTVLAVAPGADPLAMLAGPLLPRDGHNRSGVFQLTNFGTDSLAYTVGGNDTSIVYGDRDPTPQNVDPASAGRDYGDYGVTHTFLFSLSNPTSAPANVYLYERPIGGVVRSSFLVDGRLADMGCVRVNTVRYQIAAFALQPNQRYQLNVQTMTDGGSNYPLEVGLTATPPEPVVPAISAPDGCFPKPQTLPAPSPSAIPF
ncbi:MAG: hypothetical protein JO322_05765 [Candidatus Eremiobacteraeota bacterium]|nr:hypothetical protein [Candidatus Eremiobacteraeota bacterium]